MAETGRKVPEWTRVSRERVKRGENVLAPASHSYAVDIDPKTSAFTDRRAFAYVDIGVADGIQFDASGNV